MNGKALTLGLNLQEMDPISMVDVLHFFFEEDSIRVSTAEQAESITDMRVNLYRMYGTGYKYGVRKKTSTSSTTYGGDSFDDGDLTPFDPANQETKPFIPATDFNPDSANPFGSVLDAPIG